MKTAGVKQIKDELKQLNQQELIAIISRLSRFKKENKELLTYLLFEAHQEQDYINDLKTAIQHQFNTINTRSMYYTKKGVRAILKDTKKHIRFSGNKETEIDLLIHFCKLLKNFNPYYSQSKVLRDLCDRQIILIKVRISTLHLDLQHDYNQLLQQIE